MRKRSEMFFSNIQRSVATLLVLVTYVLSTFAQDTSIEPSSEDTPLMLILKIIGGILLAGGATYAIYFTINKKMKKANNKISTEGMNSPVLNVATQGEDSHIDNQGGIIGNNNTIQHGLSVDDVMKLTQKSKETVSTDFEMDRKIVEKLFSRFSVRLFNDFISMRNAAYIDNRIFTMRDGWYYLYNPIEPSFIDAETKQILREFYDAFDALIQKCAMSYDLSANPKLAHIHGLVCDVFENPEDEKNFEDIKKGIISLTPIYQRTIDFVVKRYKIDLEKLSLQFEKENLD